MLALVKTIGGMIVLFAVEAVFIIVVMAVGRLLDCPALERWFYCRVHTLIRGCRYVKRWVKSGGGGRKNRREQSIAGHDASH